MFCGLVSENSTFLHTFALFPIKRAESTLSFKCLEGKRGQYCSDGQISRKMDNGGNYKVSPILWFSSKPASCRCAVRTIPFIAKSGWKRVSYQQHSKSSGSEKELTITLFFECQDGVSKILHLSWHHGRYPVPFITMPSGLPAFCCTNFPLL